MTNEHPQQDRVKTLQDMPTGLQKRGKPIALPLTPLIDVTFLLLLYFLLTSTFHEPEQQMMAAVPRPGGKPGVLMPIHVTLTPTGDANEGVSYQINDEKPTAELSNVRAALAEHARVAADPELPVFIHAGSDVRWEYVIEIFNATSATGFKAVTFAPPAF